MDLFATVDIYCERLGPGLLAEPLNAVSNFAFIAAGLYAVRAARRAGSDLWVVLLGWWVVAIGLGSLSFHTFANRLTGLADVLPIWSFVVLYVVFTLRRFLRLRAVTTAMVAGLGIAAVIAAMRTIPPDIARATNGSSSYLPVVVAFFILGGALAWQRHPARAAVLGAGAVFLVSLTFRTLDAAVCAGFPAGVHFLWHLCNAVMLAILLLAAVHHGQPEPGGNQRGKA
ncbi:ceramidase domain-containing protein [Methylobrevis pamukkalensis]|uniref:Ceramidase n=1 Tax=Methylobrevis pamukkalensis TaxID=1439726 RepID=A0A1E3H3A6_9HYPH|nr:ceramidase domain-containing protein [Methylobrevis pamukkalensis]ODN70813.1 Ceramidase [Methylobrevis pamukkalensis]